MAKGRFSIKCKFSCVVGNFDWVFSWVMYGSNSDHNKGLLCEELMGILSFYSWWDCLSA